MLVTIKDCYEDTVGTIKINENQFILLDWLSEHNEVNYEIVEEAEDLTKLGK